MLRHFITCQFTLAVPALLVATSIAFQSASAGTRDPNEADDNDDDGDQVVLSFSTVGDSRQDPATPDPTTLPLSGQDSIWLQNTKAFSRILRSIEYRRTPLLFFHGDNILGYCNTLLPANTNTGYTRPHLAFVNFY